MKRNREFGIFNMLNSLDNTDVAIGRTSRYSKFKTDYYIDSKRDARIRRILALDIAKKYGIKDIKYFGNRIGRHSIDVLRSLLVFGEHSYIIDRYKAKHTGYF